MTCRNPPLQPSTSLVPSVPEDRPATFKEGDRVAGPGPETERTEPEGPLVSWAAPQAPVSRSAATGVVIDQGQVWSADQLNGLRKEGALLTLSIDDVASPTASMVDCGLTPLPHGVALRHSVHDGSQDEGRVSSEAGPGVLWDQPQQGKGDMGAPAGQDSEWGAVVAGGVDTGQDGVAADCSAGPVVHTWPPQYPADAVVGGLRAPANDRQTALPEWDARSGVCPGAQPAMAHPTVSDASTATPDCRAAMDSQWHFTSL
mmetsp:Transcript_38580/g.86731  ORF Transcript_38580/g.86731 Transcript_38580/m.86731 type:complete len:259 (-) Transcript_38580:20-796(-)